MEKIDRVLLIDDDDDDVFIIEDRLQSINHQRCRVDVMVQYEQCIQALISNQYDICLLDYHLGGYKGIDLLKAISTYDVSTPIVIMTGLSDEDKAKQAIQLGAQDYIAKSTIDSVIFEKSIEYAISRKALEISRIQNRQIESENIAKNKFISHLSHELRTPLTSILGYASLLLENPVTDPVKKELNIISSNGKHLLNLLNDALDMSKMLAGKFGLHIQNCDVRLLLCEVYSIVNVAAAEKKLALSFNATGELPSHIKIDETRLKQVLLNLLTNAIKFTDEGEISLTIKQVDGSPVPFLQLDIQDSGIGIEKAKLSDIFQPFTQLEDVSIRRSGGAGLGLAICTEIIQRMNGSIDVSSEKNKGTCFTVAIPIIEGENCHYKPIAIDLNAFNSPLQKRVQLQGTVLVVDDVSEIRNLVGELLHKMGLEPVYAKSAKEALLSISELEVHMVFMDLQMPEMTGQECVKIMRDNGCTLPIIAMTAGNTQSIKNELISDGFDGLLIKPIDPDLFKKVCERYLSKEEASNTPVIKRFLLIEDDEDSARIMSLLLKRFDFIVETSNSLDQALQQLSDIRDGECTILTDLNLGEYGPNEVLSAIREKHSLSPLFVASGMQPDLKLITEHGVQAYLLKPVSFDTLKNHFYK